MCKKSKLKVHIGRSLIKNNIINIKRTGIKQNVSTNLPEILDVSNFSPNKFQNLALVNFDKLV